MCFVIRYNDPVEGVCELNFTANERQLAMQVAQRMFSRGNRPRLYSKEYNGNFKLLFHWKNVEKRRQKLAA